MQRNIIDHAKKLIVVFLIVAIVMSLVCVPASAKTLAEKFADSSSSVVTDDTDRPEDRKYKRYLESDDIKDAPDYKGSDIVLKPTDASCTVETEGSTKDAPEYIALNIVDDAEKGKVILWTEEYKGITWTFNAPSAGFYNISVDFCSTMGRTAVEPARSILINGEIPFAEAASLKFKRWWKDASAPAEAKNKDQVAADLVEVRKWATTMLEDADGYYLYPFKFYFKKGLNTITFNYGTTDMYLGDVTLSAPETLPTYAEVSSKYPSSDMSGTDKLYFEAEAFEYGTGAGYLSLKSSNLLKNTSTKDTSVSPYKSGYTIINQVGGQSNWYQNRDSLEWTFKVPKTGLYKISLRLTNNTTIGMPVYRTLMIDGEIPFEEVNAFKIEYAYTMKTVTLGNDEEPYYFYITEGEHTMNLAMTMGGLGNIALTFYEEVEQLNKIQRQINKICGSSPDANFDYRLDQRIPDLLPTVKDIIAAFEQLIVDLQVVCETDSSELINNIKTNIEALYDFIEKPKDIPNNLSVLTTLQTTLGTWISDLESSALAIDFIEIEEPAAEPSSPDSSFWKILEDFWVSFLVSFEKDYNKQQDLEQKEGLDTIEIWISKDQEMYNIISKQMQKYFENGIDQNGNPISYNVQTRLTPGQIGFGSFNLFLLSTMAGNEPDMIWGVGGNDAVNFAIRGIGYNLKQFDDYEEVVKRFNYASLIPASYYDEAYRLHEDGSDPNDPNYKPRDGVYQIPETGDMNVVFYRSDIFAELGIEPPDTWDQFYAETLPAFYRENYLWSGGGTGDFLVQRNGYPFRCGNRITGYDTPLYMECFLREVDNYFVYGMDMTIESFQSFRNGTFPYMPGSMGTYTQLITAAPELLGKWKIALMPGTPDEYGIINRTYGGQGGAGLMIVEINKTSGSRPAKHPEHCWDFIKWWTSYDTQVEFEYLVDAKFGMANRWASSNVEAFLDLPWTAEERAVIKETFNWYYGISPVLGSYQQDRYAGFARNQVLLQGINSRDAVEQMVNYINPEFARKQLQYDIRPVTDEEKASMEYDLTVATMNPYYRKLREEAQAKLDAAK